MLATTRKNDERKNRPEGNRDSAARRFLTMRTPICTHSGMTGLIERATNSW
jgi:hypothetical protein